MVNRHIVIVNKVADGKSSFQDLHAGDDLRNSDLHWTLGLRRPRWMHAPQNDKGVSWYD